MMLQTCPVWGLSVYRAFVTSFCLLLILVGSLSNSSWAQNLPTGYDASLSSGVQSVNTAGNIQTIVTAAPRSVGSFATFNVGQGYTVNVAQPAVTSAFLANVRNVGAPSSILGLLQSNGSLALVNPAGVYVGPQGIVQASGFLATTQQLSTLQFLQGGRLDFSDRPGSPTALDAKVVNAGLIRIADNGFVLLAAPTVENKGTIEAPGGKISLISAKQFSLVTADGAVALVLDRSNFDPKLASFSNGLFTGIVNNTGRITANSVAVNGKGEILLLAANGTVTQGAGLLKSFNPTSPTFSHVTLEGGKVLVNGGTILTSGKLTFLGDVLVDVSAPVEGQQVLLYSSAGDININTVPLLANGQAQATVLAYESINATAAKAVTIKGGLLAPNIQVNALGGKLTLAETAQVVGANGVSLYANGDIDLQGKEVLPATYTGALVASGKTVSAFAEGSLTAGKGSSVNTYQTKEVADASLNLSAKQDVTLAGVVGTQKANLSLGAGNNLTINGSTVSIDGILNAGAGHKVLFAGDTGSINGKVNVGAGDTLTVTKQVFATNNDVEAGAGKVVLVEQGASINSAVGKVALGSGGLIEVRGSMGSGKGDVSLGSGDTIVVSGKIGSGEGAVSLGSKNGILIKETAQIGSGKKDLNLGTGGDIVIAGFAGSGEGQTIAGAARDIVIQGQFGNGSGLTELGAGRNITVEKTGTLGSGTGDVKLGAGNTIGIAGKVGSSQGGSTSLGAGVLVDISGDVGSNSGRVTVNSGSQVLVSGKLGTDTSPISIYSGGKVEVTPTGRVGSNTGKVIVWAKDELKLDGQVSSTTGQTIIQQGGSAPQ